MKYIYWRLLASKQNLLETENKSSRDSCEKTFWFTEIANMKAKVELMWNV